MQELSSAPVGSYLAVQTGVILDRRDDVLANGPDAVHATRVACRRLRSTLVTFRALWRPRRRGLLRELKWYGGLLGAPRDTEVLEEVLLELVGELSQPGVDELRLRLRGRLDADRESGLDRLHQQMGAERFQRLTVRVRSLADWVAWEPLADVPAVRLLPALAYGPVVRVAFLAGRLPESGDERLVGLHELRKRAKAARYAYEALGEPGRPEAARWKRVTESLGRVQDGEVGRVLVDDLERAALAAGEPVAVYAGLRELLARQVASGEHDGLDALAEAVTDAP